MSSASPCDRWGAPAHVEPHQAQRPVQQVTRVSRVGPPWGDVDGDAGIGDGPFEPRHVPGPKGRGDRTFERVAGAILQPKLRRRPAGSGSLVGLDQPRPEPRQVGLLDDRPLAERHVERIIARPGDRLLQPETLEHAADEPVVTGPGRDGLGDDVDAAVVPREHAQVGRGGVESDGQLRLVVARGPQVGSSDGIRVSHQQPCLDIREQLLARGLAQDQPSTRSLARGAGNELAIEKGSHRSRDDSAGTCRPGTSLGTPGATQWYRGLVAKLLAK